MPNSISPKGSSDLHSEAVDQILLNINEYGIFWKHPTGVARTLDGQRVVHYGLEGSPDIVGFFKRGGIFCGIEVKTGKATQGQDQVAFETVCRRHGAVYILARYQTGYLGELRKKLERFSNTLAQLLPEEKLSVLFQSLEKKESSTS